MYNTGKLKKLRKKKGITICDMAKQLSITPSYYWKLENQRRRLFYDMAIKIAIIFEHKPDELFYINKNKRK